MTKRALITGITGQDGSFLAELLHSKGYEVHGLMRRSAVPVDQRLGTLAHFVQVEHAELTDAAALQEIVGRLKPDEIYHLAAQSHVQYSFQAPEVTFDINTTGCMRLLEAVRKSSPESRYYQASSSEMFGEPRETPQRETTPFHPMSPYGVSKLAAFWACVVYREAYGLYTTNGILYNHESERRGEDYVTRKITRAAAAISLGLQETLHLGNLDARRDWGYSPEYVEAMWMMLQQDKPGDFIIATGETHTVREFCEVAFAHVGLDWEKHVVVDPAFFRPIESHLLVGDNTKAREVLGWQPRTSFDQIVRRMVDADLAKLRRANAD
ncbi:MAG: GDP-mannose 4,6-dehydratase [Candidatus Sumerlaeaceae bacterium]|nr:GDP-mannose 4,6-dehydratase [Candidatus Sumerlaeaceae bacterium]